MSLSAPAPLVYDGRVCLSGTPVPSPTRSHLFRSLSPPRCLQAEDQSLRGENPAPASSRGQPSDRLCPQNLLPSSHPAKRTWVFLTRLLSPILRAVPQAAADPRRLWKTHPAASASHLRSCHAGPHRYDHPPRWSRALLTGVPASSRSRPGGWGELLGPHSCQSE